MGRPKRKATAKKDDWRDRLVNIEFSRRLQNEINEWILARDLDLLDQIVTGADDGYSFKISFSEYHAKFVGSITVKKLDHTYNGRTLIWYHPDGAKVTAIYAYLVNEVLRPDAGNKLDQTEVDDW